MDPWHDIQARAREARRLLGRQYADAPAREVLDHLLQQWEIDVAAIDSDHPLLRGARAAWREEYGLVLVDRTLSPPERAFAIAHELGHRTCHAGVDLHGAPTGVPTGVPACAPGEVDDGALPAALPPGEGRVWGYNPRQARESEANVFAAELLAPAALLRARFLAGAGYRELADLYGVTPTLVLNVLLGALPDGATEEPAAVEEPGELALDASQRAAVETTAARVLVDAGPGTGKTRTLVARVLHLLRAGRAAPHEILVLTFSNRAADELRGRLRHAAPDAAGVTVATFHAFALDALRRFASHAGLPDDFRVIDDVDAAMLLEGALPDLELEHYARLTRPALYLPSLLEACSRMRDLLLTAADVTSALHTACAGEADVSRRAQLVETGRLLVAYEELLDRHGLVDYGGLIVRTVQLLRTDAAVAAALRRDLRHVLVDEYQDVNRAGAVLLQELVLGRATLWAVGDARQSIYRFRGAEPRNVALFEEDFPGGTRLGLDKNYRAAPALVGASVAVAAAISGAAPAWRPCRGAGAAEAVVLAVAPDGAAEAAGIAADISRSIADGRRAEEHAVLCRTHRQAGAIAAALDAAGLPTSYLGNFFVRPEVKDLLALLELCCGPDGAPLLRLARWPEYRLSPGNAEEVIRAARERGVPFPSALRDAHVIAHLPPGERTAMARLAAHIEGVRYYPDPASLLLHYLFGEAPYLRRLLDVVAHAGAADRPAEGNAGAVVARQAAAAIFQLVVLARGFTARPLVARPLAASGADGARDGATRGFLRYVRRLLSDGDTSVAPASVAVPDAVNVLTIHASKGLEFPVVYVPNLARGRFPPRAHGGARVALPAVLERDGARDTAEERNLFFVAVSRARDRLVLSRAERYGARASAPSDLLSLLQGVRYVEEVAWPAATPGDGAGAPAPMGESAPPTRPAPHDEGGAIVLVDAPMGGPATARDVEAVARCPTRYRLQGYLGLRDDDAAGGYRLFARLLREGIAQLRLAHGTAAWPGVWSEAEAAFTARWDERWPSDAALGPWYRRAALQALAHAYRELEAQGIAPCGVAPSARYGEEWVATVEGRVVRVRIDAVEEIDGVLHLIREQATRRGDDEGSLMVALYAAVGQEMAPESAVPVALRYLDSGETRRVPEAGRVLDRHRGRIGVALGRIAQGQFPPTPDDADACTQCPLVFVCPR